MGVLDLYKNCRLCPRSCAINRYEFKGYCGQNARLKAVYVGLHFGEEPPITGKNGSGTVFFSGCSLRCSFCQNYQISHMQIGREYTLESICQSVLDMLITHSPHNINLVTFDHFIPHVISLVETLKANGIDIPIVANVSGYQKRETLGLIKDCVDIYLPDFKYSDEDLAKALSNARDYPEVALNAISEMLKQKGTLKTCNVNGIEIAVRGVLVRHLILPGYTKNSLDALSMLYCEFGKDLAISLMSQYYPIKHHDDPNLNRILLGEEFEIVISHARELGFTTLYFQYPEANLGEIYLPDFTSEDPFSIKQYKRHCDK